MLTIISKAFLNRRLTRTSADNIQATCLDAYHSDSGQEKLFLSASFCVRLRFKQVFFYNVETYKVLTGLALPACFSLRPVKQQQGIAVSAATATLSGTFD